jgi:translation initiation factor IF-1
MPEASRPEARGEERAQVVTARVVEALPNALYRVEIEPSRERLTAHVASGGALLRLLPGEDVLVEITPYDTTRGRIVRRKS